MGRNLPCEIASCLILGGKNCSLSFHIFSHLVTSFTSYLFEDKTAVTQISMISCTTVQGGTPPRPPPAQPRKSTNQSTPDLPGHRHCVHLLRLIGPNRGLTNLKSFRVHDRAWPVVLGRSVTSRVIQLRDDCLIQKIGVAKKNHRIIGLTSENFFKCL